MESGARAAIYAVEWSVCAHKNWGGGNACQKACICTTTPLINVFSNDGGGDACPKAFEKLRTGACMLDAYAY